MRYGASAMAIAAHEQPIDASTGLSRAYLEFIKAKIIVLPPLGLDVANDDLPAILKPHQRDIVAWAIKGGRRAIFAAFGLGKTLMQLAIMQAIGRAKGGRQLIVAPLNVILEGTFSGDAAKLGATIRFIKSSALIDGDGLYITNHESVRDGKIDLALFNAATLDEADCLRGFGGSKTFREYMRLFDGLPYKFVATATPSPNDYVELLAYAAFLEVMDVGQAKTRFFKRNSEKADELTIHPHKEREFWLWVNSWAAFVQRPSDLGHSDEGYDLPEIEVRWHEVASDHKAAGEEKSGQGRLLKADAIGVVDASREKRDSLHARVAKMLELRAEDPAAHRLIWHDLEREREAIEAAIPGIASVWGSQDVEARARTLKAFSEGDIQELATKPVIAGAGCNFQKHCWWAIFLGIGFKFRDFIQAIHRIQRFLQTHQVRIDLIHSEAERAVRAELERKWKQHLATAERMSEIIRDFGLGLEGARDAIARTIETGDKVDVQVSAETIGGEPAWRVVRNDTVIETANMASDSVGLIVTSVPFSTQYEYTPSYNDFGHSDDSEHFFSQMDYLTPELLRVLKPGRVLAVHVKDRIRPGGMDGLGFQTLDPFSDQCVAHYRKHGFAFISRRTITTDVVRENNQTYRLGWSEQCKDGSRQGAGVPEYLLMFRKPQTDRSRGYADDPVVKDKPDCMDGDGQVVPFDRDLPIVPGTGYSRSRWQIDAAGYWRSSGDRLLSPREFDAISHAGIYQLFRGYNWATVYDHEHHVALAEDLDAKGALPVDFALIPATSWHEDVWSDVARMRTLNGEQQAKGKEQHLCPLQFDIVDRAIRLWSNPGELVFDPFGGLMTVPLRAVKLGRRGAANELNPGYFADGVWHLRQFDRERATPSLFDLLNDEGSAAEAVAAE
jgi:hypothetical protein